MLKASVRLLRLLSLLQARRHWSGAELAERLEVTQRTVRRDVDRLRELGYPVQASAGVAGGYRLGAGAELPPLLLDDDEALAVALGLQTAAAGTVAGMGEASVRALTKLEQVLPARLRRRVKALHSAVVPLVRVGPMVDADRLTALVAATRDREGVRFRYRDVAGNESRRHVEPHGLVNTGARWYLVAYDLDREDWRTFRVDRIASKMQPGRRFVPRAIPHGGTAAFVSRSLGAEAYPTKVRVVLDAPYEEVAARIGPAVGYVQRIDGERSLLETGGHDLAVIALHVAVLGATLGAEFQVLDPPELVDVLREAAARLARAADRSAG